MTSETLSTPITVVDLFAGAGGLSTGVAQACERLDLTPGEDIELHAINHWEPAIETHERNHPWANHYHAKIEELHPPDVVEPGEVTLLTGGPECTHFSVARGGKPTSDQKRSSAWTVLEWIQKVRPQHVLIENVPEFRSWGRIDEDGQPTRDGTIFEQWVGLLQTFGYTVVRDGDGEYGVVLNAADYGDPTSRRRLFILASKTHRPTPPPATHAENPAPGDDCKPWRTAADILDWSDPGTSLWTRDLEHPRVQPLSEKTMARIAEGIRRHCDPMLDGFADVVAGIDPETLRELRSRIVPAEHAGRAARALDDPFLVEAPGDGTTLSPYLLGQHSQSVARKTTRPTPTVATDGAITLTTPTLQSLVMPRNGAYRGLHSNPLYPAADRPLHTVTAKNTDGYLVTPSLLRYSHGGALLDVDDPMPTIATERGGVFALLTPYLTPLYNERAGQRPRTRAIDRPLMTVPANKGAPAGVASPFLVEYYGNSDASGVDGPLPTVTTRDRFGLCLPTLQPTVETDVALMVPDLYPFALDVRFRMLKPLELKQAQGFPADYDIYGQTKADVTEQIGNAVPVNLARELCWHLLTAEVPSLTTFGGGLTGDTDAEVPDYEEVVGDD